MLIILKTWTTNVFYNDVGRLSLLTLIIIFIILFYDSKQEIRFKVKRMNDTGKFHLTYFPLLFYGSSKL